MTSGLSHRVAIVGYGLAIDERKIAQGRDRFVEAIEQTYRVAAKRLAYSPSETWSRYRRQPGCDRQALLRFYLASVVRCCHISEAERREWPSERSDYPVFPNERTEECRRHGAEDQADHNPRPRIGLLPFLHLVHRLLTLFATVRKHRFRFSAVSGETPI
jgi:hypothetical protein